MVQIFQRHQYNIVCLAKMEGINLPKDKLNVKNVQSVNICLQENQFDLNVLNVHQQRKNEVLLVLDVNKDNLVQVMVKIVKIAKPGNMQEVVFHLV